MSLEDSAPPINPGPREPRAGWAEAFAEMHANGDDELEEFPASDWDENEWQWPGLDDSEEDAASPGSGTMTE